MSIFPTLLRQVSQINKDSYISFLDSQGIIKKDFKEEKLKNVYDTINRIKQRDANDIPN